MDVNLIWDIPVYDIIFRKCLNKECSRRGHIKFDGRCARHRPRIPSKKLDIKMNENIDWTIFDKYPPDTAYCVCKTIFRTHTKYDMKNLCIVSRVPCPSCGSNKNIRRASSDPEIMTIKGGD